MAKTNRPLKSNIFRDGQPAEEPAVPPAEEKPKKKEKKPAPPKKEVTAEQVERRLRRFRVIGLLMLIVASFLFLSFISYLQTWKSDFNYANTVFQHFSTGFFLDKSIHVENWMGKIGALTAYLFISKWFGIASFFFILILLVSGIRLFFLFQLLPVWKTFEYYFVDLPYETQVRCRQPLPTTLYGRA